MSRRLLIPCILLLIVSGWISSQSLLAQWHPRPDPEGTVDFKSSNLPIIWIDTHNQEIRDSPRIVADMGVIDNGTGNRNQLTDSCNVYRGKIAIELRGSSSQSYPQKPYRLETQDSLGNNLNVSLLGMPKENDWILYAPYRDTTLIHNMIAYGISNEMGRYASRTRFCELVLDGDYRGIYVLMEKIKRDNKRVDISAMDADDVAGDSLTGGYIIKIDKNAGETSGGWWSAKGIQYLYDYPKSAEIVSEQATYIRNFINEFEQAMTDDWTMGPQPAYLKYIDRDSFVDHFIINEFINNCDAYRISAFMHKDRDSKGGKLTMGPVWDMDLSLDDAYFDQDRRLFDRWEVDYRLYHSNDMFAPFWWEKLAHDPSFETPASARWQELRRGLLSKDRLYARIDSLVALTTEARERNFQKWPGILKGASYESKIQRMKQWISDRLDWIDSHIGKLSTSVEEKGKPAIIGDFHLGQNYPNPFNASTVIGYDLPASGRVKIAVVDPLGRVVRILTDEVQSAGRHRIAWDGTDNGGVSAASGIYLVRMTCGGSTKTGKLMLLR
jgi:hypothetical protein